MKYAELITKDYPIIVTKTYPIDPSIDEIDEYFDTIEKYIDSTTGPYVFISYSEKAVFISSEARIHLGQKAGVLTEKFKNRNKGSIIISGGVMGALMLKGISVVYKPLRDSIIASSLEEAYEKARELLK